MRTHARAAVLLTILTFCSGCSVLRCIEQWKCDHLGMCHFGVAPTPPSVDPCAPPAFQPAPCGTPSVPYGAPYGAQFAPQVEMAYPEVIVPEGI